MNHAHGARRRAGEKLVLQGSGSEQLRRQQCAGAAGLPRSPWHTGKQERSRATQAHLCAHPSPKAVENPRGLNQRQGTMPAGPLTVRGYESQLLIKWIWKQAAKPKGFYH